MSIVVSLFVSSGTWWHHCEPHYLHLYKEALLEEKHGMTEEHTVPRKQHTLNQTMWDALQSCLWLDHAVQAWRMYQSLSTCLLHFFSVHQSSSFKDPVQWLAHKKSCNSKTDLRNSISYLLTYIRDTGKRDSPCCPPGQTTALSQLKQQGATQPFQLLTAHLPVKEAWNVDWTCATSQSQWDQHL